MAVVQARPQRLRVACRVAAAIVVIGAGGLAIALSGTTGGGGSFRSGDRAALVGVGILVAVGVLLLARPRVDADERHVVVRNLVGSHDVTWDLVRGIGFTNSSPWATLDLVDDERIAVMAVQAIDKEYALATLTALRGLLAQSQLPDGAASTDVS